MGKDLIVVSVCVMLFVKVYDKRSIGIRALIDGISLRVCGNIILVKSILRRSDW